MPADGNVPPCASCSPEHVSSSRSTVASSDVSQVSKASGSWLQERGDCSLRHRAITKYYYLSTCFDQLLEVCSTYMEPQCFLPGVILRLVFFPAGSALTGDGDCAVGLLSEDACCKAISLTATSSSKETGRSTLATMRKPSKRLCVEAQQGGSDEKTLVAGSSYGTERRVPHIPICV